MIIVIVTTSGSRIQKFVATVGQVVDGARSGNYVEAPMPTGNSLTNHRGSGRETGYSLISTVLGEV